MLHVRSNLSLRLNVVVCTIFMLSLSACNLEDLVGKKMTVKEDLPSEAVPSPTPTPSPTPAAARCPTGYVEVAASAALGTSAFCVAKYEMKAKLTSDSSTVLDTFTSPLDVALHTADSRASGLPWVKITLAEARSECQALGAGYRLIKFLEWEAMARDIEAQSSNWSGAAVGTGYIPSGHSDGAIAADAVANGFAIAASALLGADTSGDKFVGTGQSGSVAADPGYKQKRALTLASGGEVWDVAGNAREWVDIDGTGSLINYTGPASSALYELTSTDFTNMIATVMIAGGGAYPLPTLGPVTNGLTHATNNIGQFYVSSGARINAAVTRGANFSSGNSPGIFAGDLDSNPVGRSSSLTFRCAVGVTN